MNHLLEGTRQAAAQWMKTLAGAIVGLGYERCVSDPNLYLKEQDGIIICLLVYVDNLLSMFGDNETGRELNKELYHGLLKAGLKLESRGAPTRFMGVDISRNLTARTIKLTQTGFIEDACKKFLLADHRTYSTPVASTQVDSFSNITGATDDLEKSQMRDKPFLSLMGTLLWACVTHPEIHSM